MHAPLSVDPVGGEKWVWRTYSSAGSSAFTCMHPPTPSSLRAVHPVNDEPSTRSVDPLRREAKTAPPSLADVWIVSKTQFVIM